MGSMMKNLVSKLAVVLGFIATVVVNWLATIGKINNITTAAVSDAHPTLLTPKGFAFSIWGIIYLLLMFHVLFVLFSGELGMGGRLSKTAAWFVVTCVLNVSWIFAWHYGQILWSAVAMTLLLLCLLRILVLVSNTEHSFGFILSMELPFGLYAGWISVASIANIAIFLLSLGWNGFSIPWVYWQIAILLIATLIVLLVIRKTQNIAYPVAVIWGYTGILAQFTPDFKFALRSETMWITIVIVVCIAVITARWIGIVIRRLR